MRCLSTVGRVESGVCSTVVAREAGTVFLTQFRLRQRARNCDFRRLQIRPVRRCRRRRRHRRRRRRRRRRRHHQRRRFSNFNLLATPKPRLPSVWCGRPFKPLQSHDQRALRPKVPPSSELGGGRVCAAARDLANRFNALNAASRATLCGPAVANDGGGATRLEGRNTIETRRWSEGWLLPKSLLMQPLQYKSSCSVASVPIFYSMPAYAMLPCPVRAPLC